MWFAWQAQPTPPTWVNISPHSGRPTVGKARGIAFRYCFKIIGKISVIYSCWLLIDKISYLHCLVSVPHISPDFATFLYIPQRSPLVERWHMLSMFHQNNCWLLLSFKPAHMVWFVKRNPHLLTWFNISPRSPEPVAGKALVQMLITIASK